MHPDVVEDRPGECPICKMKLVPVRLEAIWTCPVHAVIARDRAGSCPIDRRDLIQVTVAVTFTCVGHPEISQIDRGVCPDGTPMTKLRSLRPHGNHNPQHGGLFFMAPDNTHHLEGAYPRARVVTNETFDAATRTTKEISAFPLVRTCSGGYLEARVDTAVLPAQMSAKVQFKSDAPEYRFDFTFAELSARPATSATAAGAARTRTNPAPGPTSRAGRARKKTWGRSGASAGNSGDRLDAQDGAVGGVAARSELRRDVEISVRPLHHVTEAHVQLA